jgi:predicted component of type VI protein secretion system
MDSLVLEVTGDYAHLMPERRKIMASDVLRVGRREDNDWIFPQPFVSRLQMIIRRIGGMYLLESLGSCPLTLNDRRRVLPAGAIKSVTPGDRVFIDDIEIRVEAPSEVSQDESEAVEPVPRPRLDPHWYADRVPEPKTGENTAGTLADVLAGAGSAHSPCLSAAGARELGVVLRVCVDSLILMLMARSDVRRELHVAGTEVARSRNPLKNAQGSSAAWDALVRLADAADGSAVEAVTGAFDDIRYHEFALLSGHRAAFDHVVETFHPESLKSSLGPRSVLASLLTGLHRSHLWDEYVRRYGTLLSDPDDAYRTLFSTQFARAYEQTIDELKRHGRHGRAAGASEEGVACR